MTEPVSPIDLGDGLWVTVVVASAKGEGGTWSGATEALEKDFGRVAVWMGGGAGAGNEALVEAGGVPISEPEAVVGLNPLERFRHRNELDL